MNILGWRKIEKKIGIYYITHMFKQQKKKIYQSTKE